MPEAHRAYHKTSCIGQRVKLKGSGSRERAVPRQATKEGSVMGSKRSDLEHKNGVL